mgnify:CR=1 FL=1
MADQSDSDDADTKSTSTRYKYTNDLLAGGLVLFAIVTTAAFVYRGDAIPVWLATVDTFAVATAVVWAFGKGAAKLAKSVVGGGGNG